LLVNDNLVDVLREPVVRHGQVPCTHTHTQTYRQTDIQTDMRCTLPSYGIGDLGVSSGIDSNSDAREMFS